jgi:CRP-like cAMP-binding protein
MDPKVLTARTKEGGLDSGKILHPLAFSVVRIDGARRADMTGTMTETMTARLARHPFLAGMSTGHLGLLTECASSVEFKKGEVIFREGGIADGFYLIETGKVCQESRRGEAKPNWGWMFPPHLRNSSARAIEPTKAIFLSASLLRENCEKDVSFGYALLKRLISFTHSHSRPVERTMLRDLSSHSLSLPAREQYLHRQTQPARSGAANSDGIFKVNKATVI